MADPITAALADMFPDLVDVEPHLGQDGYGDISYGPAVPRRARIRGEHKLIRGRDGREQVSNVQVWFDEAFGVSADDRFTLPARFDPQVPKAIAVQEFSDENGPHHDVAMF